MNKNFDFKNITEIWRNVTVKTKNNPPYVETAVTKIEYFARLNNKIIIIPIHQYHYARNLKHIKVLKDTVKEI